MSGGTPVTGRRRSSLLAGLLGGGGAFAGGFVATWAAVALAETPELPSAIEEWRVVTWYFYNAHFVGLARSFSGFGGTARLDNNADLIAGATDPLIQYLYVVPLVALLLGGYLVASRGGRTPDAGLAAFDGAHVVLGYLPLSLMGAYVAREEASLFGVTARIGPDYLESFLLMGVAAPVVGGGLGGLVYYLVRK